MAYSDKVLEHCNNAKNVGTLDKSRNNVGTAARFNTFGGGPAIASSSLATEWLKGKSIEDAMEIDNMEKSRTASVHDRVESRKLRRTDIVSS